MKQVLEDLRRHVDPLRGFNLLSTVAKYHRVQGSEDIVEAVKTVAEHLSSLGVEAKHVVYRGRLGLEKSWFFSEPRGWRLGRAVLEKARSDGGWEKVASTEDHPLVAVVHSPPGSFEGRARLAKDHRSAEGIELPVFMRFSSEVYFEATSRGAKAVIASHTGPGVRYYGLFPAPDEDPKAPAVSIPRDKAIGLDGERVRLEVDSEYRDPVNPILYARVGDTDAAKILLIAHICHPTPGAHDNASGVAVLAETLAALAKAEPRLRESGVGVVALFVPEYTGTAIAFEEKIVGTGVVAAVSIDMVASKLDVTGGSLNLYTSIHALPSPLDPVLYRSLWISYAKVRGFDAPPYPLHGIHPLPYSIGSDHDIALSMGIPASIINEWPDHYYHTSMDKPDNIDPNAIADTASAVAAAVIVFGELLKDGRIGDVVSEWATSRLSQVVVDTYTGAANPKAREAALKLRDAGVEAAMNRLAEATGRGGGDWPWAGEVRVARRGPISSRYLRRSGSDYAKTIRSLEDSARILYTGLVALTMQATGSLEAAKLEAMVDRGVSVRDEYLEAVRALVEGRG